MKTSVNYMWIQAVKLDRGNTPAGSCPIPERFLRNAFDQAAKFPDIDTTIWYDFYGAGENIRSRTRALNKYHMPDNVKFRSLDEMDSYVSDPMFLDKHTKHKGYHSPIWSQVDWARILLINKILHDKKQKYDHVLYADMDFDLPEDTFKTLHEKGFVVLGERDSFGASMDKAMHEKSYYDSISEFEPDFDFNNPEFDEMEGEGREGFMPLDSSEDDDIFIENGLIGISAPLKDFWASEILPAIEKVSDSISGEARWSAFQSAVIGSDFLRSHIGGSIDSIFVENEQLPTDYSDYTNSDSTDFLRGLPAP